MKKTVKIGIIGMGGRGFHFFRSYCRRAFPGFEIGAVCDLSEERLATARETFKDAEPFACYTDMNEMLRKADIDAVIVATNDPDHVEPVLVGLASGRHVLAEKPLCQTVDDARRIADAAAGAKGIFMMGFELREVSLFKKMKALLDEGRIGRVRVAHAFDNVGRCGCYFHVPRKQKAFYRSLLLQKASHSLDLLNWFVGSKPVRVYGVGGLDVFGTHDDTAAPEGLRCGECEKGDTCPFFVKRDGYVTDYGERVEFNDYCVWNDRVDLNDNSELCITYAGGAKATFQEVYFTPEYTREFWLVGTHGKMYGYYDNPGRFLIRIQKLIPARDVPDNLRDVEEYWPRALPGAHGGGDIALRQEFYRRIVENDPPKDVIESAYYSTALAACAEDSIESGLPVDIPQLS